MLAVYFIIIISIFIAYIWYDFRVCLYYNPKPGNNEGGVSAMAKVQNRLYDDVLSDFESIANSAYGKMVGLSVSSLSVFDEYAKTTGYERIDMHSDPSLSRSLHFIDFAKNHHDGKYVLIGRTFTSADIHPSGGMNIHITPCVNGMLYDCIDSSNYYVAYIYQYKGNKIQYQKDKQS